MNNSPSRAHSLDNTCRAAGSVSATPHCPWDSTDPSRLHVNKIFITKAIYIDSWLLNRVQQRAANDHQADLVNLCDYISATIIKYLSSLCFKNTSGLFIVGSRLTCPIIALATLMKGSSERPGEVDFGLIVIGKLNKGALLYD